jgi:hypothetical protein
MSFNKCVNNIACVKKIQVNINIFNVVYNNLNACKNIIFIICLKSLIVVL